MYPKLNEAELDNMVADDDLGALFEKGNRCAKRGDENKARQFYTLASILGNPHAHMKLAKVLEKEEKLEKAYELYTRAYSKGEDDALPGIARLIGLKEPELGMNILRQSAADGNLACIIELVEIYKKDPDTEANKKELEYWLKKLEEIEALTVASQKKTTSAKRPVGSGNAKNSRHSPTGRTPTKKSNRK